MLGQCLLGAFILAFGTFVGGSLFFLAFLGLVALLGGPVTTALVLTALAIAGVFAAAGLVQMIILCLVAAAQAADAGAAAPGGAQQGLDEDDEGRPWPKCRICRWWQKYALYPASAAAMATFLLLYYK